MQDGDTSTKYECNVFDNGHIMCYDAVASSADKSVFSCKCGAQQIEAEDSGTGA